MPIAGQSSPELRDGGFLGVVDAAHPSAPCSGGPGDSTQSLTSSCDSDAAYMAISFRAFDPSTGCHSRTTWERARISSESVQKQRPRLAGKFLEREDANIVVVHAQVAAMGLKLRIAHLPVEAARAQQSNVLNLRGAEVYETPDKPEGLLCP